MGLAVGWASGRRLRGGRRRAAGAMPSLRVGAVLGGIVTGSRISEGSVLGRFLDDLATSFPSSFSFGREQNSRDPPQQCIVTTKAYGGRKTP